MYFLSLCKLKFGGIMDRIRINNKFLDDISNLLNESNTNILKHKLKEIKYNITNSDVYLKNGIYEVRRDWIIGEINQIEKSNSIERCRYYLNRIIKGLTEIKTNGINDINLNRWKEYSDIITDSLWIIDRRDNSGVHKAWYHGNFIPQIPRQMILRYTKKYDVVVDTFLGSGTTLIECKRLGRHGIGVELNEDVAKKPWNL